MRRSPLVRKTPLRSKPRHQPSVEREPKPKARLEKAPNYAGSTTGPVEKDKPLQHAGYMAAVRKLPCAHCGFPGPSEFCHSDEGKGTGIKSDCRTGWPGCHACHVKVGTDRIYPKQERRELEAYMAAATRKRILELGQWPASLPLWKEEA